MHTAGNHDHIRNRELVDQKAKEEIVICWGAVTPPLGIVADRDFYIVAHYRLSKCPKTGRKVSAMNFSSVVHPSVSDMEKALGRVRADLAMAGYLMRQERRLRMWPSTMRKVRAQSYIESRFCDTSSLSCLPRINSC